MLSRGSWLTRLRRPTRRLTTLPAPARPRFFTTTTATQMAPSATDLQPAPANGVNGTTGQKKHKDRSNLVPFSSRLRDGRALAQDVWSIFKYVVVFCLIRRVSPTSHPAVPSTYPQTALTSVRVT